MVGISITGFECCRTGSLLGEERVGVFAALRDKKTMMLVNGRLIRVRDEGFLEKMGRKGTKAGRDEMNLMRQMREII